MRRRIVSQTILIGALFLFVLGCNAPKQSVTISGKITENTLWNSDTIYIIDGSVVVTNGATLTIQPGTIIKAVPGEMPNVSMLVIAQDAKINAKGTAKQPIVFTALDDNIITVNETSSLTETVQGLWGGLVILGDAPLKSKTGENTTFYIGLDPNDKSSYYGGENTNHNGGVLEYVSIRHGGAHIGTGNDSNGLTLCAVGAETSVNNIEVYANQDDGIEFFGGSVNASNILVYHQGDDGIDIDEGYTGIIENAKVILGPYSDSGLEIDPGAAEDSFRLVNIHLIGDRNMEEQAILRINNDCNGSIDGLSVSNFSADAKMHIEKASVQLSNVKLQDMDGGNIVTGAGKGEISIQGDEEGAKAIDFAWTRSQ